MNALNDFQHFEDVITVDYAARFSVQNAVAKWYLEKLSDAPVRELYQPL